MRFEAIQGYAAIKQHLIHVVQAQQIPHAQLFWGPEGNASLPLALAFVTYLYCQSRRQDDACGQCNACLKMQKLVHPDVQFVFPTSATQQVTAKEAVSLNFLKLWRAFLQEQPYGQASDWGYYLNGGHKQLSIPREEAKGIRQAASFKAFEGRYKVILIWLPEYLHVTAANALLKLLEEPPDYTLFLLVSVQPSRLLGTIRSRTQQLYIPAFSDEAIASMLTQQYSLDKEQRDQLTLLAEGNFNKALKLVENVAEDYFSQLQTWMRLCYAQNLSQLVAQAEAFQTLPKERQRSFLTYALHLLREALISEFAQVALSRATAAEQRFTQRLRQTLTHQQLKCWVAWLNQAHTHLGRNVNPRILYLDLSLRLVCSFKPLA